MPNGKFHKQSQVLFASVQIFSHNCINQKKFSLLIKLYKSLSAFLSVDKGCHIQKVEIILLANNSLPGSSEVTVMMDMYGPSK